MLKKYPHKAPAEVLADLVKTTPGDPRTLTRAARDLAGSQPAFAVEAGMLALHWLVQGYGFEITPADVWAAYDSTMKAAEKNGGSAETRARIARLVAGEAPGGFVGRVLGRELADERDRSRW